MNRNPLKIILPGILCVALFSACNSPDGLPIDPSDPTGIVQTANYIDSGFVGTLQPDLIPQATEPSDQTIQTINAQASVLVTTSQEIELSDPKPCNQASAGMPLDVTIPDDTRLDPNTDFTKIWRLENAGSCTWTNEYSLVWFSGEEFGSVKHQPILTDVTSGQTTEIAVDLVSPEEPGLHSGFWMLQSDKGELFGIGPDGNSPFWVRIQVSAVSTATPTITPTTIPTSIVFTTGTVSLLPGTYIDLDRGETTKEDQADGSLEQIGSSDYQWTSKNSGRYSVFGLSEPGELECTLATLSDEPILLTFLEAGTYFCYRTGEGLPGRLKIESLPVGGSPMVISFTTWAAP